MMFKFHDDSMVNKSKIIILLRQVWLYAGKKEDFRRRQKKNKIERKRKRIEVNVKTNLTCLYL